MKFLGHHRIQQLIDEGEIVVHGQSTNGRQANCKACGKPLSKGQGTKWLWFWYDGDERATHIFFCDCCNAYWMSYIGYEANEELVEQYRRLQKAVS